MRRTNPIAPLPPTTNVETFWAVVHRRPQLQRLVYAWENVGPMQKKLLADFAGLLLRTHEERAKKIKKKVV
jgi:hypothetical protein